MRHLPLCVTVVALLWSLGVTVRPGSAQTVTIDEGTFTIFRGGQAVGQEAFQIRRAGSGTDSRVIANATVEIGARSLAPILQAAPDLSVSSYQLKTTGDGESEVFLQRSGNRFLANVTSAEGERERELRATAGSVIVEEGVAHHFYFVAALVGGVGSAVPVLRPRGTREGRIVVEAQTEGSVAISGREIPARLIDLVLDEVQYRVWVDLEGRVLRVDAPSRDYRAERSEPPA